MKTRFILVNGPWQLLYVASVLKQISKRSGSGWQDDVIFVSPHSGSPLSPVTLAAMERIAPLVCGVSSRSPT